MVITDTLIGIAGQSWASSLDAGATDLLGHFGFVPCPPPTSLLASIARLGHSYLALCVGTTGELPSISEAVAALRHLLQKEALPLVVGIIAVGPPDTPLPIMLRNGNYDQTFIGLAPQEGLGTKRIFQDELRQVWSITSGRREQFRLERHLWAADAPTAWHIPSGKALAISDWIDLALGTRISTLRRNSSFPDPCLMQDLSDGSTSFLWPNAQVTAHRKMIVLKQFTICLRIQTESFAG